MNKNIPESLAIDCMIEKISQKFFNRMKSDDKRKSKAFQYLCLSIICNLDLDSISEDDITDGDDDQRIDIIHIEKNSARGININIFDCTTSGGYSPKEISLLNNEGLSYIFLKDLREIRGLNNTKLKNKILYIRKHNKSVKCINIYYCIRDNVDENNSKLQREVDNIKNRYNSSLVTRYNNAKLSFQFFNSYKLFLKKQKNEEPLSGRKVIITYDRRNDDQIGFRFSNEEIPGIKGALVTISGQEIARLVNKYGDDLFEKNVRDEIRESKTNKDIIRFIETSAKEKQGKFWFLNNGITMVCDKIHEVGTSNNKLELFNPQIVNGQQTAFCLKEVYNRKKLGRNAKVICRIVETDNYEFAKEIAKTSNTQTKIDASDLISNDSKQVAISSFLASRGYFYKRKKGDVKLRSGFKKRITKKMLARVSMALINRKPTVARIAKTEKLFDEEYNRLFDCDPKELLLAFLIYKYCQKQARKQKRNVFIQTTNLHIASILWQILRLENIDFKQKVNSMIEHLEAKEYRILKYKKAIKILETIIKREAKRNRISFREYIKTKDFQSFLNTERLDGMILRQINRSKN
jgi:hypothetical protein